MSALDYTVGWVSALTIERVAAQALLDEVHKPPDDFAPNDNNIYVRGTMGKHKVVIAVLPKGEYGIAAASAVARDMLRTFSNIRIGLLVGIGGGAPSEKHDIRLGDIVVGAPSNGESGLFQYDFGKTIQNQEFETTGHLDKAPTILRVALSDIEAEYEIEGHQLKEIISAAFDKWPRLRKKYQQPDPSSDRLYQSHICHPPKDERSCMGVCDSSKLIERPDRDDDDSPTIHYGLIASANQLMKDAFIRDRLAAEKNVIKSSLQGKEDLAILNWLTEIDYGPQQSDYRSRRQAGTGQWLLDSPEFQEWVAGDKQSLFCPGIPGAGKTIIASIVVDYLVSKVGNTKVGLAYIYYDMRQTKLQSANHILASLLKQLAESQSPLFPGIKDLYTYHHPKHTRPSFGELSKALRSITNTYSKVFIVIDALDESRTSDGFQRLILTEIFYLRNQHNANIFITSRNIPEITEMFKEGKSLEIRARDADIEKYIKGRISDEGKEPLKELRDKIIMQTLESLPKGLDAYITAYDEAMDRIIHGSKSLAQLAISVLSWITCAKRPLVTSELQHALAIKIEDDDLDVDDLIPIKDIISVCAGLVVVDKESDTIRLVHTTTQEYFERTRQRWFPEAETNIAKACITYLLFSEFESGTCPSDKVFEARLMKYRFYDYAARNWGYHTATTSAEEVERLASKFIRNAQKVSAASQAAMASRGSANFSQNVPRRVTGLHLASYFGLWKIVRTLLLEGSEPDVKDTHGRTPLGLAAVNGHDAVISLLRASHAVDLNSADKYDNTPLSLAAARGHPAAVEALLRDDRVDRGRKDIYGNTALAWAEANRHDTVAELLSGSRNNPTSIDTPKDPSLLFRAAKDGNEAATRMLIEVIPADPKDATRRTPLSWAAMEGQAGVVKILLESGNVDVNSKDAIGRTPLSWAAINRKAGIVRLLLESGNADVNPKDDLNRTPLLWAVINKGIEVVKSLLKSGNTDVNPRDNFNRTPLLWAIINKDIEVARLLLEPGNADVNPRDDLGRTPLLWAVINKDIEVARLLLESGNADVNSEDDFGQTPLWWAAEGGCEVILVLLLKHGAKRELRDCCRHTPLWRAISGGHHAIIRLLIEESATELSQQDASEITLILSATEQGDVDLVKRLLDRGIPGGLNDPARRKRTWYAMLTVDLTRNHFRKWSWYAMRIIDLARDSRPTDFTLDVYGNLRATRVKEEDPDNEADHPDEFDYEANSFDYEADGFDDESSGGIVSILLERRDQRLLSTAAEKGYEAIIRLLFEKVGPTVPQLLLNKAACIESNGDRDSRMLLKAAKDGHDGIVQLLIKSKYGRNLLFSACENGHEGVLRLLLDKGANVNARDHRTIFRESLLQHAAKKGCEAVVRLLLEKGANIEPDCPSDRKPVWLAVAGGHEAVARLLIEKGADTGLLNHTRLQSGWTLLAEAIRGEHWHILPLLLESNTSAEQKGLKTAVVKSTSEGEGLVKLLLDKLGIKKQERVWRSLLELASNGVHEAKAITHLVLEKDADNTTWYKTGDEATTQLLFETTIATLVQTARSIYHPSNFSKLGASSSFGILFKAVKDGHEILLKGEPGGMLLLKALRDGYEALVQLLLEKGAHIDKESLNLAADRGHEGVVQLLLENSANIDTGGALRSAAERGHEGVVRLLLKKGACINGDSFKWVVRRGHEGVIQLLLENGADIHATGALSLAASLGYENIVRLLLKKGARVDTWSLIAAAEEGHEGVVRLLLENGADANNGLAIKVAIEKGYKDVIKLLLEKGARIDTWWLREAAREGHEGVVRLLLENGAGDNDGEALKCAARKGYEGVVRLLLSGEGVSLEEQDNNKRSSLLSAVLAGHKAYEGLVQLLLDEGAKIEARDVYKNAHVPVPWSAIRKGYDGLVLLSLGNGANIESRDLHDKLMLETILQWRHWGVFQLSFQSLRAIETEDDIAILFKAVKTMPRFTLLRFTRRHGKRLLLAACEYRNSSVVLLLLENGVKIESKGGRGRSLSWVAAQYKHEYVAQALIEKRARTRQNSRGSKPPVGVAGSEENLDTALIMLEGAVRVGNEVVVHQVLEGLTADMDQTIFEYIVGSRSVTNDRAFSKAVEGGPNALLKVLLRERFGTKLLQAAAGNGHEAIVQLLLGKGASFNLEADGDYNDKSPLWAAVNNGHEAVVQTLLNHLDARRCDEALLSAQADGRGKTQAESQSWPPQLLEHAVKYGHPNVVRLLLGKVDGKILEWSRTALLPIAAKYGSVGVAKILIENQADIESGASDSESPLLEAAQNGHMELVRLLLEKGAKIESTSKKTGGSPLWEAVRNGYKLTAQLLLEKGANIQFSNETGHSLLWAAKQSKNRALVWLLLEKGMDPMDLGDDDDEDSEY
ncbi:hypothetical protein TWF679_007284 [Orbilia oligospora]|uniref:Nucleoside phosphorylase domain-containing protein n=1 Tax=Orbilia oligospora TaxID=2813651 RepID=A0A8H8V821_ORBOL|nr:hypothetical protein TWF679_007284 [Orbilia oligospora]